MAPLATSPHEIEQAIQQAAHVCGPRPPAGLGWRNEWLDQAILVIAQSLAGSKVADPSAIRGRPHCGLQTGKVPGVPSARLSSPVKLTSTPFQNGLLVDQGGTHEACPKKPLFASVFLLVRCLIVTVLT
jgi:hypothetical protein